MTPSSLGEAELRAMVRELLTDLLPQIALPPAGATPAPKISLVQEGAAIAVSDLASHTEEVMLRSDGDLQLFVKHLVHLVDNPKHRADLRSGRLRFRLAGDSLPRTTQLSHRIESGAVTEKLVKRAAAAGARLVLGSDAVLTPLARDSARTAGVTIEREQA